MVAQKVIPKDAEFLQRLTSYFVQRQASMATAALYFSMKEANLDKLYDGLVNSFQALNTLEEVFTRILLIGSPDKTLFALTLLEDVLLFTKRKKLSAQSSFQRPVNICVAMVVATVASTIQLFLGTSQADDNDTILVINDQQKVFGPILLKVFQITTSSSSSRNSSMIELTVKHVKWIASYQQNTAKIALANIRPTFRSARNIMQQRLSNFVSQRRLARVQPRMRTKKRR